MIFLNFASNAFKSTRHGLVSFSAHLVQGRLRLLVSDTGIGLSSAAAKALWQPFRQASRWQSGTGLGLYHVQQLAVALGGSVGYQANLQAGSGAVFWVDLPYEPTTLPASHAASPSALQREARVPVAGAVLIAEDNVFILQLTKELLHAAGVSEVLLAANGVEAFSLIASPDAPDIALVLMDVLMPFMDGIECTRRIRQWEASREPAPPVRIIALSANGSDAACQRDCLSAGMNGVLCKPVSLEKLVATLKQGQGRRGGADPAPQRPLPSGGGASPSASPGSSLPVLDLGAVAAVLGGSEASARVAVEGFYRIETAVSSPGGASLQQISAAAARGSLREVYEQAHSLKGACACVGARAAQEAALRLERAARAASEAGTALPPDRLDSLLAAVSSEMQRLIAAQAELLSGGEC